MNSSFKVAPSVQWTERDATLAVLSGLTQLAAAVGEFAWGPVNYPVRISSGEDGLVQNFWKPTASKWLDFLVIADFFRYSKSATIVRAAPSDATNSQVAASPALTVLNPDEIESYSGTVPLYGRYPGALGNNINVYVMDEADRLLAKAEYDKGFRTGMAELWSLISDKNALDTDRHHVFVFDSSGALGGIVPTTRANRKKLTVEWSPTDNTPGLWLGTATGTSRINLQYPDTGSVPAAADVATELVSQFQSVSETIRRRNNIRSIAVIETDKFEVEFYTDPGAAAWYETSSEALGVGTVVADIVIQTYGELLERYEHTSNTEGATGFDGSNAYVLDVVNTNSRFLAVGPGFLTSTPTGFNELRNAVDGTAEVDFQDAYDLLNTKNHSFLAFIGQAQTLEGQQGAIDLSLSRRTSVTFVSPLRAVKDASRAVKLSLLRTWRNEELLRDNSYFFIDDNWGEVYDKYNNVRRFIPCCGGTAGLWFRSIAAAGIGKSPAFYNRGKYLGYSRMMWSVNDDERAELYNELGINSIVSEKEGIILMGDKTGLSRASAFSRINVRGVFIESEVNIADTAKYTLGENNDRFTRKLFTNAVEPYLRRKKESGEILDYRVKCDETNNTGQVIAENQFVAGIWIKPQYSINWVFLDFVALRPDMEFSEIEGNVGLVSF